MKTDTDPIAEAFRTAFGTVVEPPIDAPTWESLAEPASAVRPEAANPRPGFLSRPVVVAAVAAVAVLIAIGGALLLIGSGGDPVPPANSIPDRVPTSLHTPTTVPQVSTAQEAFTWDTDDLSEWITEEEMTVALRDTVSRYPETELDGEAMFDHEGGDEGRWEMGGWTVQVHNGEHDGNHAGPPSETDSRLPRGVTFEREEGFGWGNYIFSGPESDEMLTVSLWPPGTSFGFPRGSEMVAHEDMLFPLATWMLQEMGWVDPLENALLTPTSEPEPVPVMETEQVLYGAGDISCPEHWAHDRSLPVGTVAFEAGEGMFTVVVELTAAPDSEYRVQVWEPETCLGGPLLFETAMPRALTTDESGAGRTEFTVANVDPGTYRLNVNVVHTDWEDRFPDADDTRLWEIGGAGFSLVEVT